jgi:hypothetical protein
MESIERITSTPKAEPNGAEPNQADGYVGTMREFLERPRIAKDFQDLKADSQRLESVRHERDQLNSAAAEADLEAGRLARINDEHRQHRLGFRTGVALAAFFVLLDTIPANLAAQAFGLDPLPTWGITAVIVGALGAGMWAVTHYKSGAGRTITIAALGLGLVSIGALRYWFLWVTAGDAVTAVLEAVALTVFTTMMVWLGILVLSFTKSRRVSVAERRARSLHRKAERAATRETELERKLAAAQSEFLGEAQLYSFKSFESDARRSQFLDYVRAEVGR